MHSLTNCKIVIMNKEQIKDLALNTVKKLSDELLAPKAKDFNAQQVTDKVDQILKDAYGKLNEEERKSLFKELSMHFHSDRFESKHPDLFAYLKNLNLSDLPQQHSLEFKDNPYFGTKPTGSDPFGFGFDPFGFGFNPFGFGFGFGPKKAADLSEQKKKFEQLMTQYAGFTTKLKEKSLQNPNYKTVAIEAEKLQTTLNSEFEKLLKNPTRLNYHSFNFESTLAILDATKEFRKHRGIWYQINPILRGILGVIATLAIVPMIAVAAASKHGYFNTFFSKPKTNTEKEFKILKDELEELNREIKNSI